MKNIVIRIHGGLGNQLFQYALYRKHKELGHDVYVDMSKFGTDLEPRSYELANLGLVVREARTSLVNELIYGKSWVTKYYHEHIRISRRRFIEEECYVFDENVLRNRTMLIEGYWQNEMYFSDIREILLQEISFKKTNNNLFSDMETTILSDKNSVSLHIRRGDFLSVPDKYCGICTEDYYKRAIKCICEKKPASHFYVFSDDIDAISSIISGIQYTVVDCCRDEQSYLDMYLMSICRNNIIANSSFSWWGAWLNQRADKIVICPGKWTNMDVSHSMACENWIVV